MEIEVSMNSIHKRDLPKISIITPTYKQGNFIEETIQSVIQQKYPNLEYIIIDGGSTDNTVDILRKYDSDITYWVSEPDRGQAHAINKGLAIATGDIIAYLNSDDIYLPETLFKVANHFCEFPTTDFLYGACRFINESGDEIGRHFGNIKEVKEILDPWGFWWAKKQVIQPEAFWSKRIAKEVGYFDENLYFVMDYDYWCRIICSGGIVRRLSEDLACFRYTTTQKTVDKDGVSQELLRVLSTYLWNANILLSIFDRLRLQGNWIYQTRFLRQVENSIEHQDTTIERWGKSVIIAISQPQILFSNHFRRRCIAWLSKMTRSQSTAQL
jgi:glycosyltransferase involved in cell wall biosynthesis